MRTRWWLPLSVLMILLLSACETAGPAKLRQVPTYDVVGGGLSEDAALGLLTALHADLGKHTIQEFLSDTGALFFMDEERFQALPLITGEAGVKSPEGDGTYTEFALNVAELQRLPDPPDVDQSVAALQGALQQSKLHPGQIYVLGKEAEVSVMTGHSNFELLDETMAPIADVDLDTHVALELGLAADTGFLDLVGQGGSLKAVFDANGAVLVHYELLNLKPGAPITVISEDDAVQACTDGYSGKLATAGAVGSQQVEPDAVTAELIYYAPPLDGSTKTVYPYYQCGGTVTDGNETLDLRTTYVKANPNTPAIMTPATGEPSPRPEAASTLEPAVFGVHDAGTEWVGETGGLPGSRNNAGGFFDTFAAAPGVNARFNWGETDAWERDYKDPAFSGTDSSWADNVDVNFYTGHANGNGFVFTSEKNDGFLDYTEARWGNHDLEWLVIAACGPLQDTNNGLTWGQRWGRAFHGLHLLMAYATISNDNQVEGRIFARAILGVGESPKTIRAAWVKTATTVQPSSVTYAVMGVGNADGFFNWNDYFWGKGTGGGPDLAPGDITFYWKLAGPS